MREVTVVGVREWPARAVNKNSTQLNIPALLAQLVERLACNPKVRGSIPSGVVPVEGVKFFHMQVLRCPWLASPLQERIHNSCDQTRLATRWS